MVLALQCFVTQRGIEGFGVYGRVQFQVCQAMLPRDAFNLLYQGRADTPASRFGHDIARSQFRVVNDQRTESCRLAVDFRNQANLVVGILEEMSNAFVGDTSGAGPRVDDLGGIVRCRKSSNRTAMDVEEQAALIVVHQANDD